MVGGGSRKNNCDSEKRISSCCISGMKDCIEFDRLIRARDKNLNYHWLLNMQIIVDVSNTQLTVIFVYNNTAQ